MGILEDRAREELKVIDVDTRYDEMLDECYSFRSVGGPFEHMLASTILENMDPIAYKCGFSDWLDNENLEEIDGEYYDADEVQAIRDEIKADEDGEN